MSGPALECYRPVPASARAARVQEIRSVDGIGGVAAPPAPVEPGQCAGESFAGECVDVGVVRLVEELFDLLLANGQSTQSRFDPFHGECKQHEQHWEKYDSKSLHDGK